MPDLLDRLKQALADRYLVDREIGRGGMAQVFLAQDLKLDRPVALKVLRPELAAVLGGERFLREITLAAKLEHPHILGIHDSGDTDGVLYYVMPYAEGESLRDRLTREKQLPVDDALQISREVADALSYAHSHGVIHRDIKPENILLEAGHAVVADFGIARAIDQAGGDRLTGTGIALGTPAYMSPEQAAGSKDLDGRSDLYSLGCVLYEMLAGHPPFVGASVESLVQQHLTAAVPPITGIRPAVPAHVAATLERALAKTPADRFNPVALFAEALVCGTVHTGGSTPAAQPAEKSIAVLPFANMSADPENEYFSDGLSEDLITALAKIPDFRVAARTSAFSFKGERVDARVIGRKLNVVTVLEGSVRKAGDRLRITAQLINADDGYHLWSEQYDRVNTDVFAIQDEITGAIVDALKLELLAGQATAVRKKHTTNVDVYHLYLKGRYYWNRSSTEAYRKAIDHFRLAIEKDPVYAPAYAGLADAYASLGDAGCSAISPKEAFSSAKAAVEQALELDDSLGEAFVSLGHLRMHEFAWTEAEQAFTRTLELTPAYATAYHMYAFFLAATGRSCEATATLQRALELDPLSLGIATDLGVLCYFARQFDQAIAQYHKVLDMDPGFIRAHVTLSSAYARVGRYEEAIDAIQRAMELSGDRSRIAALGRVYGAAGRKDDALRIVAELLERSKECYVTPYVFVLIYASMDEKDEALNWLRKACDEGVSDLIYLKVDPFLDNLRPDPRFATLLESVGFGQ